MYLPREQVLCITFEILDASSICVGGSDISDKAHSPNECFKTDNLVKATICIAKIIKNMADVIEFKLSQLMN